MQQQQQVHRLTVSLQISKGIVEALLAHLAQHLGVGGKEDASETVEVGGRKSERGVDQVHLEQIVGVVLRANVGLARKGRTRDCILIDDRQIVATAAVDISDAIEFGRHQARPQRDEARALNRLTM